MSLLSIIFDLWFSQATFFLTVGCLCYSLVLIRQFCGFVCIIKLEGGIVYLRWSGEGMWIPLGDMDFSVGYEDATSYPAPGQILLYPKGRSETEILIAYGCVQFASKAGVLAGNHFATITNDLEKLREIGIATLWEGKKDIKFTA